MADGKKINKIKSSVFSRGLSLAKITLNASAGLAGHGIKKTFANAEKKQEQWKDFLKSQAQNISTELGELKGSLMKAGQMLSMYGEHFLPAEANEFLKTLQMDSPALSWEAIEPELRKHLTPEQLAQLEIEKDALACASLGQVHRARIKATGETLVLKIQYPNVDKAIDNDLRAIRTLLSVMKLIPKDLDLDPIFHEIRAMLTQETDYELEAKLTQEFYEKLKNDSRFVVPRVYPEFSNKKILATSYERGLRVDDPVIQSLNEERRQKLALNFLDLYFKELFEWRVVQTDPHLGNYRIRMHPAGHDQLVLFDFGATRRYDSDFIFSYQRMIKGSVLNDKELFSQAALEMKFIDPRDRAELLQLFEDFCFETVEPFLDPQDRRVPPGTFDEKGNYDWKNTTLPQRLSKKVLAIINNHHWRTPPREIIFLDRKTGGVFVFLSVLRAKCQARGLLLRYLERVR